MKITAQKVAEIDNTTHQHELRSTFCIDSSYPNLSPSQINRLKTIFPPSNKGAESWIESLSEFLHELNPNLTPSNGSLTAIFLQSMHAIILDHYTTSMQLSVDVTTLFKSILLLHIADDPMIRQQHLGLLTPFLRENQNPWKNLPMLSTLGLSSKSSTPAPYDCVVASIAETTLDVSQTLQLAKDVLFNLASKDLGKAEDLYRKIFHHITTNKSYLSGNKVLIDWLKLTQNFGLTPVQAAFSAVSQELRQPASKPLSILNYCVDQHQKSHICDSINEIFATYVAPYLTYDLIFAQSPPTFAMVDYLLLPNHLELIHETKLKKSLSIFLDQRIADQKTYTLEEMKILGEIDRICEQLRSETHDQGTHLTPKVQLAASEKVKTELDDKKDAVILALRQKLTNIHQEANTLRQVTKNLDIKTSEDLAQAQEIIADLETELANANADLISYKLKMESLITTSKQEKSEHKNQFTRVKKEHTALTLQLEKKINELQTHIQSLESQHEIDQSKIKLLKSQNTSQTQALDAQARDSSQQAQLLQEQTKQLDELQTIHHQLTSEITSLRLQNSTDQSRIQSSEAQIQYTKDSLPLREEKDQKMAKLADENQHLASELESLRHKELEQSQRIFDLESQLKKAAQSPASAELTLNPEHTSTQRKPGPRKRQHNKSNNGTSSASSHGLFSDHYIPNHANADDNHIHHHLFQLAQSLSKKSSAILWVGTSAICHLRALHGFPVQHMTFDQLLTQYENINVLVESNSSLESIANIIINSLPNSSAVICQLNNKVSITVPFEGELYFTIDVKLSTKINLRHYPSSIYFSWHFRSQEWTPHDLYPEQYCFLCCCIDTCLKQLPDEKLYSLYWSIHQWIKTIALGYIPTCTFHLLDQALSKKIPGPNANHSTIIAMKSSIATDILSIIKKFINTPYQKTCFNSIAAPIYYDGTSLLSYILPDGAVFDRAQFSDHPKLTNAKCYDTALIALKSIWKSQETNPSLLESTSPFNWSSVAIEPSPHMAKNP